MTKKKKKSSSCKPNSQIGPNTVNIIMIPASELVQPVLFWILSQCDAVRLACVWIQPQLEGNTAADCWNSDICYNNGPLLSGSQFTSTTEDKPSFEKPARKLSLHMWHTYKMCHNLENRKLWMNLVSRTVSFPSAIGLDKYFIHQRAVSWKCSSDFDLEKDPKDTVVLVLQSWLLEPPTSLYLSVGTGLFVSFKASVLVFCCCMKSIEEKKYPFIIGSSPGQLSRSEQSQDQHRCDLMYELICLGSIEILVALGLGSLTPWWLSWEDSSSSQWSFSGLHQVPSCDSFL